LVLIDTTILNMLHADEDRPDGRISRTKLFGLISIGAFLYAFVPGQYRFSSLALDGVRSLTVEVCALSGYLFAALGYFSWVCWIRPSSLSLSICSTQSER
jgi:hypothetical protein